jgi:hypothetical protein
LILVAEGQADAQYDGRQDEEQTREGSKLRSDCTDGGGEQDDGASTRSTRCQADVEVSDAEVLVADSRGVRAEVSGR